MAIRYKIVLDNICNLPSSSEALAYASTDPDTVPKRTPAADDCRMSVAIAQITAAKIVRARTLLMEAIRITDLEAIRPKIEDALYALSDRKRKKYRCRNCGENTHTSATCTRHNRLEETLFRCDVCDNLFHEHKLISHMKYDHLRIVTEDKVMDWFEEC